MLQITLTPAPIPFELIGKSRRRFFIAAAQVMNHPDFPTSPAHQRGLDKVMAENFSAQRRVPRQTRKAAMLDEWRSANNRIMAPIVTLTQLPETLACRQHGTIGPARKLLQPSKK